MGQLSAAGKVLNQTMSKGLSTGKKSLSDDAALESKFMQRNGYARLSMKASAFKQPPLQHVLSLVEESSPTKMTEKSTHLPELSIWTDRLPDV